MGFPPTEIMPSSSEAVESASNRLLSRVLPLLIATVTFVLYAGALGYDFLNFDDLTNVVENYHLVNLRAQDFQWMFTGTAVSDYKPTVWLSYAADRLVWGLNPAGFILRIICSMWPTRCSSTAFPSSCSAGTV